MDPLQGHKHVGIPAGKSVFKSTGGWNERRCHRLPFMQRHESPSAAAGFWRCLRTLWWSGRKWINWTGCSAHPLLTGAAMWKHFKMTQSQQCGHRSNAAVRWEGRCRYNPDEVTDISNTWPKEELSSDFKTPDHPRADFAPRYMPYSHWHHHLCAFENS